MYNENSSLHGEPQVCSDFGRRRSRRLDLTLMDPLHPCRVNAETFLQAVLFKTNRARLNAFYPLQTSIANPDAEYAAVAGVRPAGGEALFSEHFLEKSPDRDDVNRRALAAGQGFVNNRAAGIDEQDHPFA